MSWPDNIDLRYGPAPARKGGRPGPSLKSVVEAMMSPSSKAEELEAALRDLQARIDNIEHMVKAVTKQLGLQEPDKRDVPPGDD